MKETTKKTTKEEKEVKTKKKTVKESASKATKEVAEPKKKTVKRNVEKKKIVKLEEEPVIEEKVEDKVEDKNVENPTIVLDEQPVIDKKHDYSKIIIAIIAALLIGLLIFYFTTNKKGNNNTYSLSLLCETCFEENDTFTLPANYELCEDGSLFIKEDNILKYKGGFYAGAMDEETFNAQVDEIKAQFPEAEDKDVNGLRVLNFVQQYDEEMNYDYNFIYKDGTLIELVLFNPEEGIKDQILNGISF